MALGTLVVGAFTGALNSVALGMTEEGYELQWEPKSDMINRSDVYGDTMIDFVHRGIDYFMQTEFKEYKAGPIAAAQPWAALGVLGTIGRLGSDVAVAMVLTATAGTTAAATPATLTANKAILAPNSNPRAQFNSRLRTLPVRMVLLPYDATGIKFFTTT